MTSNKIIRQRNLLYELWIMCIWLAFCGIWWLVLDSLLKAFVAGGITYFVVAWSLRLFLQKHQKKGMACMRTKNYEDALKAFKKSFQYFEKHPLVDKYRFITMFSSSAISYRHLALNNIGVCYLYMGDDNKALDYFKKLAEENGSFPHIYDTIEAVKRHIYESEQLPKT